MNKISPKQTQQGAVLLTSLVLLAVITIIGAYVFSTGVLQERMAANNQLVTMNKYAGQSSVDAYVSEGMIVSAGSLSHEANAGVNGNIVRRTLDQTTNVPKPFVPLPGNVVTTCVNNSGAIEKVATGTETLACDDVDFQNTSAAAATNIKGRSHAYYVSCTQTGCGPGMAASLGSDSSVGCPVFYLEGSGWLDLDGDGEPPAGGSEEARVYVDEWLRWQRTLLCTDI